MKQFLIVFIALAALHGELSEARGLLQGEETDKFKCTNFLYTRHTDPEHCDRYYSCKQKKAYSNVCPPNRLFSTTTRACALPAFVSCGKRAKPGQDSTTEMPTTTEMTTTTPKPTTPTVPTTTPECPAEGSFPDYTDCTKFYLCTNGVLFNLNCRDGTIFDTETEVCDFPYKVKADTCSQ